MRKKSEGECDCGNKTKYKNWRDEWVCDRCLRLEELQKEEQKNYASNNKIKDEQVKISVARGRLFPIKKGEEWKYKPLVILPKRTSDIK